MKLVAAKCPSCGANIDVDKNSDSTVCEFCNTKIIVEEAIEKQKVEISGEIEVKNLPKLNNYLKLGGMHYNDGEYEDAYKQYEKACELDPDNHIAVLRKGITKAYLSDYAHFGLKYAMNGYKNAYNILVEKNADESDINSIISECNKVIMKLEMNINDFFKKNSLNINGVSGYITKLTSCLDSLELINRNVKEDKKLKKIIINNILYTIDIITMPKQYQTGKITQNGSPVNAYYKFDNNFINQMNTKKNYYLSKLDKIDPKPIEYDKDGNPIENKRVTSYTRKKNVDNAKTLETLSIIGMVLGIIVFIISVTNLYIVSIISSLILVAVCIPIPERKLTGKKKNKMIYVYVARGIIFFVAFLIFGLSLPREFENTWTYNDTKIELTKGKAYVTTTEGKKEGTYTYDYSGDSKEKYVITVTVDGTITKYVHEKKSYNEYYFCKIENEECVEYYQPTTNTQNYKYIENQEG